MAIFKNAVGTVLGHKVIEAKKVRDGIKIENRLLDGSFHFQTIGSVATLIEVELIASTTHKDLIDGYEAMGIDVNIEFDMRYYIGPIRNPIGWSLFVNASLPANRLYRGIFQIVATGEGDLT